VYTSPDYLETNVVKAKAKSSHRPNDPNLLKFDKGAIITNIVKQAAEWWRGDFEDQKQKLFPADYVEEIAESDTPFGELLKGSVVLGKADIERGLDETLGYVIRIWSPGNPVPFKVAVKSGKEAREWQEAINEAYAQVDGNVNGNFNSNQLITFISCLISICLFR